MTQDISKKVTIYQIMRVLNEFITCADSKGDFEVPVNDAKDSLYIMLEQDTELCAHLHELASQEIISFYEGGEDGFRPSFFGNISKKTHEYLATLIKNAEIEKIQEIQELEGKISNLNGRIEEIFSFDPIRLSSNLENAQTEMNQIAEMIDKNKTLEPLKAPLNDIRKHYASVKSVSDMYEDVYKNIIKPVENAGKSGVRETVKWAIFAMIFSVISSIVINNFSTIQMLIKKDTIDQMDSKSMNANTELKHQVASVKLYNPEKVSNDDILKRIQQIESQLLFPETLKTREGEVFVSWGEKTIIANDENNVTFYLYVDSINDWPQEKGLKAGIKIYKDSIQLGRSSLNKIYARGDGVSGFRSWFDDEPLAVDAGDTVLIGNVKVKIIRVLSRKTEGRLVGDEQDGIVIQKTFLN